ncbi:hypothetical protein [Cryobacterium luteum]|uniref:2OG-Fe(II) oxygenase n=1 Tax=Cryobacterium luteum TaxID=1424661 RepID=A0A1H8L952_9MICO|nr:hypothetical protein [Cryobacterium luteum]TFB94441.1 hypothetical protein E3O10_01315 [Cryobacterium luteum]SEO01336.1 hypothetical protein SAMN05216281_1259 [Cryobacterium luteum]
MDTSTLVDKIALLSTELSPAERENLKLMLSMAAGGLLVGHAQRSSDEVLEMALRTAQKSLPALHGGVRAEFTTGVVFRGKTPFFSASDLASLDEESKAFRPKAVRFHDHYVASGAPVARQLSVSQSISDFLLPRVGPVLPTYRANHLYYDAPGLGIDPHVDKDEFSLNVLTMLEHEPARRTSELILFPPDQEEIHVQLQPGESLIFFADSVTHQRTRTVEGETVRLVSFGYRTI